MSFVHDSLQEFRILIYQFPKFRVSLEEFRLSILYTRFLSQSLEFRFTRFLFPDFSFKVYFDISDFFPEFRIPIYQISLWRVTNFDSSDFFHKFKISIYQIPLPDFRISI